MSRRLSDSVVSETSPLVVASEESPLLQANPESTRIYASLQHQGPAHHGDALTGVKAHGTHSRHVSGGDHDNEDFDHGAGSGSNTGSGADEDIDEDGIRGEDEDAPLPWNQILLLCYCRIVEPIAFFSIFPFVNQMIKEIGGVREEDVGFYSGFIESLFSLTQMCTMIFWGRAADRVGRKPVLVFSLTGVGIATSFFGLSKAIWQMVLFRCLAGVFGGTVVTVRTMITEHSTPKTQARAFSLLAAMSNLGIFIGPVIGGAFANAGDYKLFSHVHFFRKYPYALPSFIVGTIGLSSAIISALFVRETLERKPALPSSSASSISSTLKPTSSPMTTRQLLHAPGVAHTLLLYNYVLLLGMSYTAVVPVFWFTSSTLGGYSLSPPQISVLLGGGGLCQAIWTLVVFPPLHARIGTKGILRICAIIWPLGFAICPVGNVLLKHGLVSAFWALVPLQVFFLSGASMAFTSVQLALNDVSPGPEVLGTLNAVALAATCGVRAFAPAVFAGLYAESVRTQALGGYAIWALFVPMACAVFALVRSMPKKAQGKIAMEREDGQRA